MKFKLVDPIGKKMERVLVRGEIREFNLDQWEKSDHGTKIRELRKANNIGLREAAKVIGISATELSKVETGKLAFEDESDFDYICNIIFTWMGPYGQHSSH